MTTQNTTAQQAKVLDELIDNAIGLPVGSQDLLLMMAKAMRHTRDCMAAEHPPAITRRPSSTVDKPA